MSTSDSLAQQRILEELNDGIAALMPGNQGVYSSTLG